MYNSQRVRKALIPAAGLGTRMQPATLAVPKELLPVGKLPMIHYAVCEALSAGVEEIFIVINHERKKGIQDFYYGLDRENDACFPGVQQCEQRRTFTIHFLEQPFPLGIVDAIVRSKRHLEDERFFLLMPDNVFWGARTSCQQIMAAGRDGHAILGLIEVTKENAQMFGNSGRVQLKALGGRKHEVIGLADKSAGAFLLDGAVKVVRMCGRYLLGPEFFEEADAIVASELANKDEVPILKRLIERKHVLGVELDGVLFDCGNWRGYRAANEFFWQNEILWS